MAQTQVMPELSERINPARRTVTLGKDERRSTERTANILIIDHSGSTEDPIGRGDSNRKIDGTKEAVSGFLSNVPQSSYICVISFSANATVLWDMQPLGGNGLKIINIVQDLEPATTTRMQDAFELAESKFRKAPSSHKKRAYLLADGIEDGDSNSMPVSKRLKQQNVQLNVVGFGEDFEIDEDLLRNMASVSASGTPLYYHFTDARNLTGYLKRESQFYRK